MLNIRYSYLVVSTRARLCELVGLCSLIYSLHVGLIKIYVIHNKHQ